jgi:hypothetical protein
MTMLVSASQLQNNSLTKTCCTAVMGKCNACSDLDESCKSPPYIYFKKVLLTQLHASAQDGCSICSIFCGAIEHYRSEIANLPSESVRVAIMRIADGETLVNVGLEDCERNPVVELQIYAINSGTCLKQYL